MIRNINPSFDWNDAQNCICLRINQKGGGWCGRIVNTVIFLAIILVGISAWKFSLLENTGISLTTFVGVLSLIGFIVCRQVCISFIILNFGGCTIHGLCDNSEKNTSPVYAIEMQDCPRDEDCQRFEEIYRHDNVATQRFEEVDVKERRFEEHLEKKQSGDRQICVLPNGKEVKAVIHEQENILDQDKAMFECGRDKRNPHKSVSLKERRRLVLEALLLPNKQRKEQEYSYDFLEPVEISNNETECANARQNLTPFYVMKQQNMSKESSASRKRTQELNMFKYCKKFENSGGRYESFDSSINAGYTSEHNQGKRKKFSKAINSLLTSPVKLKERKSSSLQATLTGPSRVIEAEKGFSNNAIFVEEMFDEHQDSVNVRERRTASKEATMIRNSDERSEDAMVVVEEVHDNDYQDPVNVKERRTASKEATMKMNTTNDYYENYGNTSLVIEEMSDRIQDSVNIKERKTSTKEAMMLKSYDAEDSNQLYESDFKVMSSDIGVLPEDDCRPEGIVFATEQEEEISWCSRIFRFIVCMCMILVEILPALMLVALAVYFDINLTGMLRVKVICLCLLSFNLLLAITRNRSPTSVSKNQEKVTVKLHAVLTKN